MIFFFLLPIETSHLRLIQFSVIIALIFAGAVFFWKKDSTSEAGITINAPQEDHIATTVRGYWKMDEGTGTSTTADASGNGNALSMTGPPTWTTGQIGPYSMDFSGTAQYLSVADPGSGVLDFAEGASFTLTGWFNRDLFAADHTIIAKKNDQSVSGETGYIVWVDNASPDTLCMATYDGTDGYSICSTSDLGSSGWKHFAITWNDSATTNPVNIYINGALDGDADQASGTFSSMGSLGNARAFTIGAESDATAGTLFDGKLDDVRVYGFPLSADEVSKLYQTTAPMQVQLDSGLVGYWTFNGPDIKGSTVIDRSGKGNDGTITGAVPVKGKVGQGLSFDGTGDYVSIVDSGTGSDLDFENGDSITITAWVNPREISGGRVILTKDTLGDCGYTTNYYLLIGDGGTLRFFYRGASPSNNNFYTGSSDALAIGEWQLVTLVYTFGTGSSAKFYKNGVWLSSGYWYSGDGNDEPEQSNQPVWIGASNYCGGESVDLEFSGSIDDVRIYNRTLSATEITNLYNLGR